MVEEKYWGGVCLNVGCIPSKALLKNAELAHMLTHEKKKFGIEGDATMSYGPTHARSRQVSAGIVKGVHFLMKKNKITEIDGWGTLGERDGSRPSTSRARTAPPRYTCDDLIIATGATVRMLPGMKRSDNVVTYEEQILDELPGSIIIGGSGAIGVEFAYVMKNFGVDVTIVEFLDRMVPTEDADVSKELLKHYKKLGVKVLLSTKVENVEDTGSGVKVTVSPAQGGDEQVLEADKMLAAFGFAPRLEGYGLDTTGVEITERGAIAIDEYGRTNVEHVYAIGDVTGKMMLAHVAEAMGIVAAETIAGAETMPIDFDMIPRATYCQPQIGSFGYSEAQAKEKRLRRQDRDLPVLRQRQGPGPRRGRRLRQGRRRRRAQRDPRRAHDRPRRHRAAAGAHPGAAVGPHRRRGGPQRLRPPDADRGGQGSRPRHRRPHDQLLTGLRSARTRSAAPTKQERENTMAIDRAVILGGGPGGYEAALVAAQLGAEVTVVDSDGLGGSAVLTDCVPSKTLIATAEVMSDLSGAAELGVSFADQGGGAATEIRVDLERVNARVKQLAADQSRDIHRRLGARRRPHRLGPRPSRRPRPGRSPR